jgi:exonuclease III
MQRRGSQCKRSLQRNLHLVESNIFSLHSWQSTMHWIKTSLLHLPTGKILTVINVYMPTIYQEKIDCWSSLQNLQDSLELKDLIIVGDLNTTLHPKEKKGGSRVWDPTREHLEDLISSFHLLDINPSNGRYTWSNRRIGPRHITARLDRFLLSSSFLDEAFLPSSCILPWTGSDHRPITLNLSPLIILAPSPSDLTPCGSQIQTSLPLSQMPGTIGFKAPQTTFGNIS